MVDSPSMPPCDIGRVGAGKSQGLNTGHSDNLDRVRTRLTRLSPWRPWVQGVDMVPTRIVEVELALLPQFHDARGGKAL
jgi:hypothetical protein